MRLTDTHCEAEKILVTSTNEPAQQLHRGALDERQLPLATLFGQVGRTRLVPLPKHTTLGQFELQPSIFTLNAAFQRIERRED